VLGNEDPIGFLLVFNIADRTSFSSVTKWSQSIAEYRAAHPSTRQTARPTDHRGSQTAGGEENAEKSFHTMLIGNQCDRGTAGMVTTKEAQAVAKVVGGMTFMEVSATKNFRVEKAFASMTDKLLSRTPPEQALY